MDLNRKRKERSGIPAFKVKEADVIRAVAQWLSIHRIPYLRMNSGALKSPRGQLVPFGRKGASDFLALGPPPEGKAIWIECKRPSGGILSAYQREFLDMVNRRGCIGIVVRSAEELEEQLKEAGMI
jgi:hypothetical protein